MTGFNFVTKRKLKTAIALAKADGKFHGLNPVDFMTVLWGKEAYLFNAAGFIAKIYTRSDCTIFVGHVESCNPRLDVTPHTM